MLALPDEVIEWRFAANEWFGILISETARGLAAIKFRMGEKGLSPRQLEPFIGSRARVSEVLSGKRSLSIDMIRSLHEGLGIPYESLMARPSCGGDVENISGDVITRLNTPGFSLDRDEISSFISSSLRNNSSFALHRKTRTQRAASKTDPGALLLWQAAVLQKSEAIALRRTFDRSTFTNTSLRQLAKLSSKIDGPRRVIGALSKFGIALVAMPPLSGTFLDGAAMVRPDGAPVAGLTLRHNRIDNFWFALLHELAIYAFATTFWSTRMSRSSTIWRFKATMFENRRLMRSRVSRLSRKNLRASCVEPGLQLR